MKSGEVLSFFINDQLFNAEVREVSMSRNSPDPWWDIQIRLLGGPADLFKPDGPREGETRKRIATTPRQLEGGSRGLLGTAEDRIEADPETD
jgi:hypothetical protein